MDSGRRIRLGFLNFFDLFSKFPVYNWWLKLPNALNYAQTLIRPYELASSPLVRELGHSTH